MFTQSSVYNYVLISTITNGFKLMNHLLFEGGNVLSEHLDKHYKIISKEFDQITKKHRFDDFQSNNG